MFNLILVFVDIFESCLIEQVIFYVQVNVVIGNGKIYFLMVVFFFFYYLLFGLVYLVEMLKFVEIQEEVFMKFKEMVKQFNLFVDCVEIYVILGVFKDQILKLVDSINVDFIIIVLY